ncbi:hypothetical protein [Bacillus massilinigeriensis]|uniref:hypothetical protein n=1 Tax=Bacillus massilionigeriensis TaxID=1805475 RepID=UPI00096B56C3|nr:hypothetical protein [Bacillus massilionigeriensis]
MCEKVWDYQSVLIKVKDSLPAAKKIKITDIPVPVTIYKGIYCSIFGAPLEKDQDGIDFEYKEMKFPRYNPKKQNTLRANGRMIVIFPDTASRNGSFIVAHEVPSGHIRPIIEVSDAGRACFRARQWAMLFQCDFQEKVDGKLVMEQNEYRKLLIQLSSIQVI